MRHRFFAIHVLAGGAGIGNHLAVLVIGYRDNDGVDILAVENRSIVAHAGNVLLDRFLARVVSRVVKVANGYALDARHAKRRLKQLATSDARTN